MKKKSALVLGASSNQLFALGSFLVGLGDVMPNFTEDIIVFYDSITDAERRGFSHFKNLRLVQYDCPFRHVDGLSYFVKEHFTLMVYSKYECFRLLDDYECVIWMDYDAFVLNDISELLTPVDGGIRAIVTERITDSLIEGADFPNKNINGIHSSVFALYDCLKGYSEIYDFCIENTPRLNSALRCPEQAVMSLALHEMGTSVYPLDFRLYSNPMKEHSVYEKYVKIYHTFGKEKFWCGIDYLPWNICKERWDALCEM